MIRRYLGDYSGFKCTADKCPDSCCKGWEIGIDDESIDMYKFMADSGHDFFNERVDFEQACFKQDKKGDCACLRPDGLCQLQMDYGQKYLCATCDLFPRHIEEFPEVREYSLSASCPEVALSMVRMRELMDYEEKSDESVDADEYEDFNQDLYNLLLVCRHRILAVLREEDLPLLDRYSTILYFMEKVQGDIDMGLYPMEDLDQYLSDARAYKLALSFEDKKRIAGLIFEMDPLDETFVARLSEGFGKLFSSQENFDNSFEAFMNDHQTIHTTITNLSIYFIFTYFCGAVYDDYVLAQARAGIFHSLVILLIWVSMSDNGQIGQEDMAYFLYKYCRELENCTENIMLIEHFMDEID
ncbi:MAG: flagellin lysine-N-methylase [Pseudobutyrivibrio sp.]|nr:flagellin lysine-N-methylase [Pseudobutyrivibrio sp.]